MKLKLVESAKPLFKLERNINKFILPAIKEMGYHIDIARTLKEKYSNTYFGTYKDYKEQTIPFELELNSASPYLEEPYDLFATLKLGGTSIKLGSCFSNNSKDFQDLIDASVPDAFKYSDQWNNGSKDYIKSKDGKEEHTDEEWKELLNTNRDSMEPEQFKEWLLKVYPGDISQEEAIEALKGTRADILSAEPSNKDAKGLKEEPKVPNINTNEIGKKIEEILANYGVTAKYETATIGPAITQYEYKLSPGTKISELTNLSKELAMGLEVKSVAIAPVEGKSTMGIQVPNKEISIVSLDEVLEKSEKKGVSVALGKDLNGNAISADILDMQHVLIGGSTGSGKSASINSMIISLIKSYPPDLVKLILIDPKKVELQAYKNLPHLAQPIVTNPSDADKVLKNVVDTMDNRYSVFERVGVKNIKSYNNLVDKYNEAHPDNKQKYMPYLVVVIDELADLMMTAGKSVESSIQRITQLARAAGIHMIVATQRPSADVVTGPIKSNIASRIAFATPSNVDSRVILDQGGAEKLLGRGDMLFKPTGASSPKRIQGAYVTDEQVDRIVKNVIDKYK